MDSSITNQEAHDIFLAAAMVCIGIACLIVVTVAIVVAARPLFRSNKGRDGA